MNQLKMKISLLRFVAFLMVASFATSTIEVSANELNECKFFSIANISKMLRNKNILEVRNVGEEYEYEAVSAQNMILDHSQGYEESIALKGLQPVKLRLGRRPIYNGMTGLTVYLVSETGLRYDLADYQVRGKHILRDPHGLLIHNLDLPFGLCLKK